MRIKMLETFGRYEKGKTYDLPEPEAKRVMNQYVAFNDEPCEGDEVIAPSEPLDFAGLLLNALRPPPHQNRSPPS